MLTGTHGKISLDPLWKEMSEHPKRVLADGRRIRFKTDSACNTMADLLGEDGEPLKSIFLSWVEMQQSRRAEESLF